MTSAEVLFALVLLAALVGPVAFGARRLRQRILPACEGAPACLAEAVLVLSHLTVVSEVLGTFGLFRASVLIPVAAVSGLAVGLIAQRGSALQRSATKTRTRPELGAAALAAGVVALVAARWALPVGEAYRTGIVEDDSIAYHLPFAARFVQEGSLSELHFAVPEFPMAFYPGNYELFHALGMLACGDDLLSPGLNLGWLALLLVASWCIGRMAGAGPAALAGVAVVAGSPLVVTSQAGSAQNDIAAAALFLTAAALLLVGWRDRPTVILAGLAAGLALGAKFTLVLPVAALTLGVAALAWRDGRRSLIPGWLGAVLLTGGYWYLRNLVEVGSPIPPLRLGFGSFSLTYVEHQSAAADRAIADYADSPRVVWRVLHTAALEGFGSLWPLVALAVAVGLLIAVRWGNPVARMLGVVAVVCAAGYLFTPATAYGPSGNPIQVYVTANVRYALPALTLALVLLAISPLMAGRGRQLALTAVFAALVASMQPARRFIWEAWRQGASRLPGLLAAAAVLAGAAAMLVRPGLPAKRSLRVVFGTSAVAVATLAAVLLADRYYDHRYLEDRSEFGYVYAWAQGVRGQRIGVAGTFRHYPLYGLEQSNHVQYLGRVETDSHFSEITTCEAWRRAVNSGGYDYIVTMPNYEDQPPPTQARWTRSARGANEVLRRGPTSVFRIVGPLVTSCSGGQRASSGARRASEPRRSLGRLARS